MVKFKVNYSAHISRAFVYIDYDRLKLLLHEDEKGHRIQSFTLHAQRTDFTTAFEQELQIVDNCYTEHMVDLEYSITDAKRLATEYSTTGDSKPKPKRKAQEAALKRSLTQIYDKLSKIETYCLLNRTAAIKILKKHDKLARLNGGEDVYDEYILKVNRTRFGGNNKLNDAQQYIEELYCRLFCDGVMEEARGKLRLAKIHTDPRIRLSATFKVGIVLTLLAWLANYMLMSPHLALLYLATEDPSVYIYSVVGGLVVYRWMWGFSVYMWDSVDIDYTLILDLDSSKHMPSSDEIFSDAGNLSILFMINVLIFMALRMDFYYNREADPSWHSGSGAVHWLSAHAYIMPMLLAIGTIIRVGYSVCQPTSYGVFSSKIFWNVSRTVSRTTLVRLLIRCCSALQLLSAPFAPVELRHTFAADILCSLVRIGSGVMFSTCYFYSGAYMYASAPTSDTGVARFAVCHSDVYLAIKTFIFAYPYTIRMMQCLRQRRDHFVAKQHAEEKKDDLYNRNSLSRKPVASGGGMELHSRNNSRVVLGLDSSSEEEMKQVSVGSGDGRKALSPANSAARIYDNDHVHSPNGFIIGSPGVDLERGPGMSRESSMSPYQDATADNTSAEMTKDPSLSRSETRDLPVPPLLRCICPERKSQHSCAPKWLRELWLTIWVWPYSYNALRYFLNVCVVVFGAYPPTDPFGVAYMSWYIPLSVIASLYGCYWDIWCDFKLMQCDSTRPLLRDKILYEGNEGFYYFVLVIDPILRFMWTLSFTPYGGHPFFLLFEIVRRSLWACLRMELGYIQELARRR
jgi:hypothetical protein